MTHNQKPRIDRIGEKRMQKCGLEAEIIEYRKATDMDVRFSNGTIVRHRAYVNFKKGSIGNPDVNQSKKQAKERIGKTHMQKCGLEAKIIEYRNVKDIDVRLSDGTIVRHKTYTNFKKGSISYTNTHQYKKTKKRIGEKYIQKCGLEAEVIEYYRAPDINIIFPDGTIIKHKNYHHLKAGSIKHPNINAKFNTNIGNIYPRSVSKIYHTEIHGIAYVIDNTYYYFCHCPICKKHEIWTFNEIRNHNCNQELVKERDEFIQTLKTQSDVSVA